jgi:hypothetical protein
VRGCTTGTAFGGVGLITLDTGLGVIVFTGLLGTGGGAGAVRGCTPGTGLGLATGLGVVVFTGLLGAGREGAGLLGAGREGAGLLGAGREGAGLLGELSLLEVGGEDGRVDGRGELVGAREDVVSLTVVPDFSAEAFAAASAAAFVECLETSPVLGLVTVKRPELFLSLSLSPPPPPPPPPPPKTGDF